MLPRSGTQSASPAAAAAGGSGLPSPEGLFAGTTSPAPFDAVYRSIEVDALPVSQLHLAGAAAGGKAKARAAPAAAAADAGNSAAFPQLAWPLESYPRGQFCTLRNEEPAAIVAHVEKKFKDIGCQVEAQGANALVVTAPPMRDDECRSSTFSVSVWDVSRDAAVQGEGKSMVDITRLAGCPFVFHDAVTKALGGPTSSKRFCCLGVPAALAPTADASPIRPACIEAALERCLTGTPQDRVQGVCSLANLCHQDPLLREAMRKLNATERLAPLLREDAAVKKHAERLFGLLAA